MNAPVRLEGFDAHEPRALYQAAPKIFARSVRGPLQRLRALFAGPVLVGYFLIPWLSWGDRPLVLFDLPTRQFHLAGLSLWPQDLWLLGWLLMVAAFALFTATTMLGRAWCGYACPQTLWTELFMWAERKTEGERHQRVRLDNAPWTFTKVRKRTAKHALWLAIAFATAITFVGYFTPIQPLAVGLLQLDFNTVGFWAVFWVGFFTLATYFNAGWLREQVCLYMCPYARFQSAMIDADTLTVAYDHHRGEPRGARKRDADPAALNLGDCVNCQVCVQVCPTGIDIRNGLQYQCIGCARCIDGCNAVMQDLGYAPGLIRYSSERALNGGEAHTLRARSLGYAAVTAALGIALILGLATRNPLSVDILRERGSLYHVLPNGDIGNDYQLKLINKGATDLHARLDFDADTTLQIVEPTNVVIPAGSLVDLPLRISGPRVGTAIERVTLRVCSEQTCNHEDTTFVRGTNVPEQQGGSS